MDRIDSQPQPMPKPHPTGITSLNPRMEAERIPTAGEVIMAAQQQIDQIENQRRDNAALSINQTLARQEPLKLLLPKAVGVVGVGGVGSWLAYFLALAGVPQLWLFDHDTVSDSNLNRLPVPASAVGELKSRAMAAEIIRLRPNCDVWAMGNFDAITADNLKLSEKLDWLAVTTDTLASRQACYKWAYPKAAVTYIEAAADGEYGSATGTPAEWASELEANPGYASVPVHVGPCVVAAAMASYHILHATPLNKIVRIGWQDGEIKSLIVND